MATTGPREPQTGGEEAAGETSAVRGNSPNVRSIASAPKTARSTPALTPNSGERGDVPITWDEC